MVVERETVSLCVGVKLIILLRNRGNIKAFLIALKLGTTVGIKLKAKMIGGM